MMLALMLVPVAALQAEAERFAGRPVAAEPRLALPACADVRMKLLTGGVEARCVVPAWRVLLPFETAAIAPAPPAARGPARGARVETLVAGAGFEVRAQLVADGPARDGHTWLKAASGRRLRLRVNEDGTARATGLKASLNGR